MKFRSSLRRSVLSCAVAASFGTVAPVVVFAQAPAPNNDGEAIETSDTEEAQEVTTLQNITVVGTYIRGVEPVGSAPVVVGREDATLTGLSNVADIVRRLPQAALASGPGFQGGTAQQGYNQAQTETISLRGLGAAATLVLVDGRRQVGAGAVSTSTEANRIPLAALERVEVLPDGASALYGSDAVAGVVNYVVRKDMEGVELTLRTGDQSGGDEYNGTITAGKVWSDLFGLGHGNVIISYDYQNRDAFLAGDVARLRQDLRPLGGPDMRVDADVATVGFAPNIIGTAPGSTIPSSTTWTYWGVPQGDGTGLTAGDLLINQPNLLDAADYTDYIGEQTRHQAAIFFNQTLGQSLELFGGLDYTDRETTSRSAAPTVRIRLTPDFLTGYAGTPFAIPGLPADQTVQYSTLKDGQTRVFDAYSKTYGAVLGLRADLPGDWKGEFYYNYGRNEQCDSCMTGSVNLAALTALVQAGTVNPLSSAPLSAAQIGQVYGESRFESRTTLKNVVAKFDGSLFELPAGAVKAAFVAGYQEDTNANRNTSRSGASNAPTVISTYADTELGREVKSLAGELYFPLISRDMEIPLVKTLQVSAAMRYDDYSDVGSTTNPRLGFTWRLTDSFRVMGTWGTSFRAPSLTDINPRAVTSGTLLPFVPNMDPRIGNVIPGLPLTRAAVFLGSNPALTPEESDNWSLTAAFAKGSWDLSASFWNIKYDNQIAFPGVLTAYLNATPDDIPASGGNYDGWGQYVIPVNNPVTCDNGNISSADPVLQDYLRTLNYDFISGGGDFGNVSTLATNFCGVRVILDSRVQNVASVRMSGVDLSARHFTELGEVTLSSNLALSRFLKNDISTGPGVPAVRQIDGMSDVSQPKLRGVAGVTALWRDFDATLSAQYTSGVTIGGLIGPSWEPLPDSRIDAYTEFDLTLGYGRQFENSGSWIKGWRVQLAVNNLLDDEPDFFASRSAALFPGSTGAWVGKHGLPFGRTYSLQLTMHF